MRDDDTSGDTVKRSTRRTVDTVGRAVALIEKGGIRNAIEGYAKLFEGTLDGEVNALTTVATLLTYNIGIDNRLALAHAIYVAATRRGDAVAQFNLAGTFLEGAGVAKDTKEGIRLLRAARRNGSHDATDYLGHCYREGEGVAKNEKKGYQLSLEAANAGVPAAEYAVGSCLINGQGVAKDAEAGRKWMERAAHHGYHFAEEFLDREQKPARRGRKKRQEPHTHARHK
jgi:uncharacterized protein